jgi:hypothetical protein
MLKNYVNQQYLKGFIPALEKYLRLDETDFSKQKEKAEQIVINDFIRKGYDVRELMLELELSNEAVEDELNRLRVVATATVTATIIIQASNDNNNFENVLTLNFTGAGTKTELLNQSYSYYKATGNYEKVYLVETIFDLFFAYKWIEIILADLSVNPDDNYAVKSEMFFLKYADLFRAFKPSKTNQLQTNNLEISR